VARATRARRRSAGAPLLPALLLLLLAAAPRAGAQPAPDADQQARGLLQDALGYRQRGQYKQALDNLNTITAGFAGTDSADDAYLQIGLYHLEVEGNPEKAREAFEQVAKRFPQGDAAPGAYYYLGVLAMSGAATSAELDDALAQFDRIRTLYPRSDWVPESFHATGLAHRKAGRLDEAVAAQRRVTLEYPTAKAAAAAQFQIGHCLALKGEPRPAMEEYQRVRNRFPDTPWAASALERITALYRLYGGPAPAFSLDAGYAVGAGDVLKDVRALLLDPGRTLWIASAKTGGVVPFDGAGRITGGITLPEPRSLSLSPQGELVAVARAAVRIGPREVRSFAIPSDKPGVPESLERLSAALLLPGGGALVADEKKRRVYRFGRQYEFLGSFPDAGPRDVARMALDGEGGIVLLDRDARTVAVYDGAGRLLRSLGGKGFVPELRRPVDVAVDPACNLYVADEEGPVHVFSPRGRLLATLAAPELRRPRALALDGAGAVLVYDEKAQRVLRFR